MTEVCVFVVPKRQPIDNEISAISPISILSITWKCLQSLPSCHSLTSLPYRHQRQSHAPVTARHGPQTPLGCNRNWYQYWGINFYYIKKLNYCWISKHCQDKCSKLSQNCPGYSVHGYMCTAWGQETWLFLHGNTCSNHCDVTIRLVALNSSHTLHQNIQQNSHYQPWETSQDWSKCFDKIILENSNYLQWLKCLTVNTPMFYLVFGIIIFTLVSLSIVSAGFKLNNGTFQRINHLTKPAILS